MAWLIEAHRDRVRVRLLFVVLRQEFQRVFAQVRGIVLAALRHFDDAFGQDFAGAALVGGTRQTRAGLFELFPGVVERRA